MYTRILSLLATRRHYRHWLGATLGVAGILLSAPTAQAQVVYGLGTQVSTGAQGLSVIDPISGAAQPAGLPTTIPISGVTAGQRLVGIDFRPANGQLYALGYNAGTTSVQLYTLNTSTGAATSVAAAFTLDLGTATDEIAFDFNPLADRIRVVSTNDVNVRLNPITGTLAVTDPNVAYASGTPANPAVSAVAYTNSFAGTTSTVLYDIDRANNGILSIENQTTGVLTVVSNTITFNGFPFGPPKTVGLDIYYNPGTGQNEGFLTEVTPGGSSNFYRLNLATGAAIRSGNTVPAIYGYEIRDIATAPAAPLTGQLIYATIEAQVITAQAIPAQLVSFDSEAPGIIRSSVPLGQPAAGEVLAGIDFRPATGELYTLGYNSSTAQGRLYTIDRVSGALAPIGAGPVPLALGGAAERIGFDFNPTVDRIRVVSTNGANYRLVPTTGAVAFVDGNLTAGPVISGAAYTNNQSNLNTTTLYDYDATNARLYTQNPPNSGTLNLVGSSGITPPTSPNGADFDIFNVPNTATNSAYLAVNAGAAVTDNLYAVDLTTGAATLKGQVGFGVNVSGLGAFISAGTLLTWNGSVSTDWGTAANWTPAQVPTANNDVVIPSNTPNIATVSNAQQARNVTLNSGTLTLANTAVLSVGGNFTNNSGFVGSTVAAGGQVLLVGASAQTVGGTLSIFPNLTVGPATATLGGPVSIRKGLVLNGNLTATGQVLTLISEGVGTAFVVNNGANVVNGNATVQRYIAPNLNSGVGYRHYSAPVANSTVADLAAPGFAPEVSQAATYNGAADPSQVVISPFPNVYKYNETRVTTNVPANGSRDFDRGFEVPASTAEALEVARGYTVNIAASATVDFVGTLNNGQTPLNVTGLTRGGLPQSGWHLRGNPFPSPLDWNLMISNGRLTNMETALYVFKSSGQYTGSYASYAGGMGNNGGTNVLPVAQGFFVRTAAGQTGSLSFTNQERFTTDPGTTFQRTTADTRPQLALTLANATTANQTTVYFDQGATPAFDGAFDAVALPAPNGLVLATTTAATPELLAINGLPTLTGTDVLLPLSLAVANAGSYTLRVDRLDNLPANYHAYLRDALNGTFTDLATTPSISLTLAANAPAGGRYALLFTTQSRTLATAPAALAALASVYPNPAHGTATLLLPVALRGTTATAVSVVDNLGRTVLTRTLAAGNAETLELPLSGLAAGVYSVQARTASGLVAKRLVVQ
jgi:hypothetical protein